MDSTVTLPVSPQMFWGLATLGGLAIACLLVFALVPRNAPQIAPLEKFKAQLGLAQVNGGLFLIAAALWLAVFGTLVIGLFGLIWDILWHAIPDRDNMRDVWDWRFRLVQVTALTTVLGAVVVLPITLNRLRLQRKQARTAEESLFNDKINAATTDLYARRSVSVPPRGLKEQYKGYDRQEDDIARRNAAIDRLEGLVRERPDVAERVSRLLSVYVRELSKEVLAEPTPKVQDLAEMRTWARRLIPRSDMENAVQTLGRLRAIDGVNEPDVKIDLRGANLQGMDLRGEVETGKDGTPKLLSGNFRNARLDSAQIQGANLWEVRMQGADLWLARMQGADLWEARMQGAELWGAVMQGANLEEARMQGADLREARMQGADLSEARMQGADLGGVEMDDSTDLTAADLRGAAVKAVSPETLTQLQDHFSDIFCDGFAKVDTAPSHWPREDLDYGDFTQAWRAWQRTIGQDPEAPE